jgi:hypothetical protein
VRVTTDTGAEIYNAAHPALAQARNKLHDRFLRLGPIPGLLRVAPPPIPDLVCPIEAVLISGHKSKVRDTGCTNARDALHPRLDIRRWLAA